MSRKRGIKGCPTRVSIPEWEPLFDLAPDHLSEFMWMFSVELSDGTRLQAYKHYWTRGYLHLDGDGRAFFFIWDESDDAEERYEEVDPERLLGLVLRDYVPDAEDRPEEVEARYRVVFRVPKKVRRAAQKRADLEGLSLSELAAESLSDRLKRTAVPREREREPSVLPEPPADS